MQRSEVSVECISPNPKAAGNQTAASRRGQVSMMQRSKVHSLELGHSEIAYIYSFFRSVTSTLDVNFCCFVVLFIFKMPKRKFMQFFLCAQFIPRASTIPSNRVVVSLGSPPPLRRNAGQRTLRCILGLDGIDLDY